MQRKLAAVLMADVAGYGRLSQSDEEGTRARFQADLHDIFEPQIAEHHGRLVKTMGDGVLVEFGSVVDALRCAIELERAEAGRNASLSVDRRLEFRIGINLGDVIVEGDDIHGDGVIIAERLQGLAEPGGITISGTAYDQVKTKIAVGYAHLGEQPVKNIAEPVRVYRVLTDPAAAGRTISAVKEVKRPWRRPAIAAGVALLAAAAGLAAWLRPWEPPVETASVERMALPLPDKPSIAVLPFDNLSADPEQGYFADGMTEDLITDLSKISGIFVIARNSSWAYKGKPIKVQQVAEELGVRYVLEGSVRRQGDQVRINAQLIDAMAGHHLWAERYDGALSDVFALQDKVIGQIVAALAVKLTSEEQAATAEVETGNPEAYDSLLQGWDHLRKDNEEETLKAITLFNKAIELDPGYSRAYAALATANWRIVVSNWEAAAGAGFEHAFERTNASLAKAMEKPTSLAYAVSAEILTREGRHDEAFAAINKAMALAPNDPENYIAKAKILDATGRAAEAEEAARRAMRLDPRFAPGTLRVLALSLFHQERYQETIDTIERVLSQQSDVTEDYATLVSSLGHLGRSEGVQAAIDKYNAISVPAGFDPLTVQEMGWWWYGDTFNYDDAYRVRLQEGLRKAGVPEGAGTDLALADYKRLIVKSKGEYDVIGATEIDPPTAKALRDRGVPFVDVRAATDFDRAHIPGARSLSLPFALSKESLAEVAGKDDEIVFSCAGKYCPSSAYASAKALLWGYTHVYRFAGGFPAWKDAGYPVEASTSPGQ